ncbi:hypothetical protein ACFZC3_08190 [Streptomyces sp. NPDC007903]|uniref:hypothetical protein n=1 Tax=Streptomyces sp. NPDC007903 TaxID=3364786 RepID=UPI0036E23021
MSRLASRATARRIVIGRLTEEVRELIRRVFRTGKCLRPAGYGGLSPLPVVTMILLFFVLGLELFGDGISIVAT